MDVPQAIINAISARLNVKAGKFTPISGGCINNGGRLDTVDAIYFVKWNNATRFPAMFETEAKGLAILESAQAIRIPHVVLQGESEELQFIVMEFIETERRVSNYWPLLGERLAGLHKSSADRFGLDHNNYIGSLDQINSQSNNWVEFFVARRLQVQLDLAIRNSYADRALVNSFEKLFQRLPELLPVENPSLLHGDLWSGNLITDEKGGPCLIDPAVYYGHREIELSFTRLFGGFDSEFYHEYNQTFPLERGFEERVDIYNLYPLLVHLNLFGLGYLGDIRRIIDRYE